MSLLLSGLDINVSDSEALARFCTSSSWVAKSIGRVKHQAFLPAPDDDTSVYRIHGMSEEEIWDHAATYFVNALGEPYSHHGAAVVNTAVVRNAEIQVIADEGPPRHANLRGWPKDTDPTAQKARRMAVATRIADNAKFLAKT